MSSLYTATSTSAHDIFSLLHALLFMLLYIKNVCKYNKEWHFISNVKAMYRIWHSHSDGCEVFCLLEHNNL
jgi:hypothetical protein